LRSQIIDLVAANLALVRAKFGASVEVFAFRVGELPLLLLRMVLPVKLAGILVECRSRKAKAPKQIRLTCRRI